jgi:endonuclease YncB( thermonuclease family)
MINEDNKKRTDELIDCTTNNTREYTLDGIKTTGKILEVYDGDSCKIALIYENKILKYTCRLNFIDAPEIKPLKKIQIEKKKLDKQKKQEID